MALSRRRFAATLTGLAGFPLQRLFALRPAPKLFVFLIAEQFRQVYLDRMTPFLSIGGFRELMNKGTYYPNCRMAASSFTSSGLATLATGAYPQLHGIVADQWYDRSTRSVTQARADKLEATTLADEASRLGNGRVFCIGINEGPTSLLAGRTKTAQVFWMDQQGQYSTRGSAPDWLAPFNAEFPAASYHDKRWIAINATGVDLLPMRTLIFDARHPEEFLPLFLSSPYAQMNQFELLRRLIAQEKLGQGETSDFVFVSLGSMALLGNETGADNPLMLQMALHLDRQIQLTLEALNKTTPGKGNYNLIFAAAHGALPDPDAASHSQLAISGEAVARAINKGFSDWFGKGDAKSDAKSETKVDGKGDAKADAKTEPKTTFVQKYVYPFLYLNLELLHERNLALRGARKVAGEIALRVPGVAGYYTADGDCSYTGEWRRRFENSFNQLRSGDVMLAYEPGAVEDFYRGRGVSYGSLYNYDTRVPLFFYGPQFGKNQIERVVEAVDIAPTVARAASLALPSSATGEVLSEAFADASEDEHAK